MNIKREKLFKVMFKITIIHKIELCFNFQCNAMLFNSTKKKHNFVRIQNFVHVKMIKIR